jgi:hypothetical protein
MRWPKWQIAAGPGDFLPVVIAVTFLSLSVPAFVLLALYPDYKSDVVAPLLVILGIGVVIGLSFLVLGVRLLSMPGSLMHRLAHGRFFGR